MTSSNAWREQALKQIRELDATKRLIAELTDENIRYNRDVLTVHREITIATDEELVRALLTCRLHYELGYPAESIELKVPYKAGRPKIIKPRIDVLLRDNRKSKKGP